MFYFRWHPAKNNSPKGGQLITDLHDLTPPWVALRAPRALKSYFASTIAFFLSPTYGIDGEKRSQNRRLLFCWEVARRCLIKMHHLLTPSSFNLPFLAAFLRGCAAKTCAQRENQFLLLARCRSCCHRTSNNKKLWKQSPFRSFRGDFNCRSQKVLFLAAQGRNRYTSQRERQKPFDFNLSSHSKPLF